MFGASQEPTLKRQRHTEIEYERESKRLHTEQDIAPHTILFNDVYKHIFANLSFDDLLEAGFVCKNWQEMIVKKIKEDHPLAIFNIANWADFFGLNAPKDNTARLNTLALLDYGILPSNIREILEGPCPANPESTVQQTHTLIFLAPTICGKKIDCLSLGKNLKKYLATSDDKLTSGFNCPPDLWNKVFNSFDLFDKKRSDGFAINQPHWVLISNEVFADTLGKDLAAQQAIIGKLAVESGINYKRPKTVAAISSLIAQLTLKKGKPLNNTCTRCEENATPELNNVVGNLNGNVFLNAHTADAFDNLGIAPAMIM